MRFAIPIALLLATSPLLAKEAKGMKSKAALAKTAKTDLAAALGKATAKVPGKAVEVEIRKKKGKTVWEVEVLGDDGTMTEVDVDADSGEVVDTEGKSG